MKKLFAVLLCVTLAVVAVACVATAAPSSEPAGEPSPLPATPDDNNPPVAPADSSSGGADSDCYPAELPTPIVQEGDPMIADAAMYRGTVTKWFSSTDEEGKPTLLLEVEQAEGTNYGAPKLQFAISNDSRISFPLEQLNQLKGKYLEIYYSYNTRNAPDPDEVYDAIHVVLYPEEGMVNFNGVVAEIIPHPEKEGEGRLLMTDMNSDNDFQTFYLYGPDTKMYLNFEDIKVGDKLNIFHSPAMALSMPPQCAAWEIRDYKDSMTK